MTRLIWVLVLTVTLVGGPGAPANAVDPPTTVPLITAPAHLDVVTSTFAATATSSAPRVKFVLDSPFSVDEVPVVADPVLATPGLAFCPT